MKNKVRCVIIDDEKHAISLLKTYISSMPNLELFKTFNNPLEALSGITAEDDIDIIFLDIEMPHLSGIELAKELRPKARSIIFTSAYNRSLEAFEVRANHYLLKPLNLAKFTQTVMSIIDNELSKTDGEGKNIKFFKTGEKGKLSRIDKQEILYFESAKNYVSMVTADKKELVYLTLKEVEKIFCKDLFYRVHRSHVINADKIQKIVGNTINLGQGYQVQMGGTYKSGLLKFLEEKTLLTGRI
ncbi:MULTISPECIES: LytTR family DNA-binding domain-containing protein [unclassified Pedobacter]|uniref:LytR/AlgR family response regulator transcription factor n=1 Tax=unclassified Pedobacter TaxID=2628915 RepID=UPI001D5EC84F|nr:MULTISPECIES: LytTR family DNA-binding domain-containing protein [unclassified Pedobacter]CAH0266658.1 Transcriptional regulatory protein YehT [Pedobacter sp. Bi36]CAH0292940.1 Transcriptional regulatory protein YehT [Pedobacter sp. Bi126]